MLRERSREHEALVTKRFADLIGPIWQREGSFDELARESVRLLHETRRPLSQAPLLSADGRSSAVPDILYWDGDQLVVLEARLALRPEARSDFALQLAHFRALLIESAGIEPARFEIVNGIGETVNVTPASAELYADALAVAGETLACADEPTLLLAHSTCRSCDFYRHCWDRAEAERRIEILPEVQSAHVEHYHALGVRTVAQLAALDVNRLPAGLLRQAGKRAIRVAAAWRDNRAEWLNAPGLPGGPIVWFDLEGDSRGEEALIPIYLWGLAFDDRANEAVPEGIVAEFGPEGDRAAWERFVERASAILARHPDVHFVHWDNYEPLWIRRYFDRYGAPEAFRTAMLAACFDLKRVLDRCVRLPLRSYSIKHVAPWMGFRWRNPESGSEWSVAHYQRASTADDPAERERLLAEILEYNEDDLWAMRAVWRWLEGNAPKAKPQ
jgi:predicted RecB family nuclease